MGDSTAEDIKRTAQRLITQDRSGVIEALRYWLSLKHVGLSVIALGVIGDIKNIPELKPDLERLRADPEFGRRYAFWIDRALKAIG